MKLDFNHKGKDFIIGDLHGCYDLLQDRLWRIGFDKENDRLFSVGDLIDRGPDSMKCLKLIKEPWFFPSVGNHEDMMLDVILKGGNDRLWVNNGGLWYLDQKEAELLELCKLVDSEMQISYTIGDSIGICHAQPPSVDWSDAINPDSKSEKIMLWARSWIQDSAQCRVENIDYTIHGHTPIDKPTQVENAFFIDTGAFYTGNLTITEILTLTELTRVVA